MSIHFLQSSGMSSYVMLIVMMVAIYFIMFLILFFTGSGRYSVDYLIDRKFTKDKGEEV